MPSAAILSERRRRGPGDCFAARNEMRLFVWPRDRRVYCDLAAGDEGVGGRGTRLPTLPEHTLGDSCGMRTQIFSQILTRMRRTSVRVINSQRRATA